MNEKNYYLAFSLISGIGPKSFIKLLNFFKTAKAAWESNEPDLLQAGLGKAQIKFFLEFKRTFSFSKYSVLMRQKRVKFIALCDKEYPELLKQIENPPIVLFYKGDIRILRDSEFIGIVGTRRITNYGKDITQFFASGLAMSGITVVSGLAMGVDAVAAWSALNANGKTIAVLGNGVDLCFPSSNENLYDKILHGNGIIVSEFPLGQSPTMGSFPSRNRIIAGLSMGVLVTEGAQDSGSLITADYAFKFNRMVFAVPGPITSSLSVAPLKLIEKGAKLVVSPEDILRNFQLPISNFQSNKNDAKFKNLTKEEVLIVKLLENESLHFDEIVRNTSLNSAKAGTILSIMEIKGIILNRDGIYSLINN